MLSALLKLGLSLYALLSFTLVFFLHQTSKVGIPPDLPRLRDERSKLPQ